jgi:hypothetical protein
MPSPLLDYWMKITWFSPSHRLSKVLKAPKDTCSLLASTWASPCFPLYFSSLTFNKLPLHPRVPQWILSGGILRIW